MGRHLSSAKQPPRGERAAAAADPSKLDQAGIDRLFRECACDVHGYAISLLGDRAGAEDVTALAFERLYRSRACLDRRRGTPRAWLFAIARNAALDELRRRRRQRTGVADEPPVDLPEPLEAIEHAERRATVQAALRTLAPREREIVLLKFHGQLTNGELARVLGISESNAGTRVYRALNLLRDTCAELGREEVA
ncbi:MAG: RNA polymerase sigma factor [Solirubrobacteraceae bacterium]